MLKPGYLVVFVIVVLLCMELTSLSPWRTRTMISVGSGSATSTHQSRWATRRTSSHQIDGIHKPITERIIVPVNDDITTSSRSSVTLDNNGILSSVDVLWQLPRASIAPRPIGIILLFHGCSHQALDWELLPMERNVWHAALTKGFALLAFSSLQAMHAEPVLHTLHPFYARSRAITR
jgi:hypothetical protein